MGDKSPEPVPVAHWLGIDVGWVYPAVDSRGRIYTWGTKIEHRQAREDYTTGGDVTITKPDGTVAVQPAYSSEHIASLLACDGERFTQRCQRIGSRIAANAFHTNRGVALEDGMGDWGGQSARWPRLFKTIAWFCRDRGVPVVFVPRAYTSQQCSECGYTSPDNRPRRSWFECQACEFATHADTNAAVNIAARAQERYPAVGAPVSASERRCTGCGEPQPHSRFPANSKRCRTCVNPDLLTHTCGVITKSGHPCKLSARRSHGGVCGTHKGMPAPIHNRLAHAA